MQEERLAAHGHALCTRIPHFELRRKAHAAARVVADGASVHAEVTREALHFGSRAAYCTGTDMRRAAILERARLEEAHYHVYLIGPLVAGLERGHWPEEAVDDAHGSFRIQAVGVAEMRGAGMEVEGWVCGIEKLEAIRVESLLDEGLNFRVRRHRVARAEDEHGGREHRFPVDEEADGASARSEADCTGDIIDAAATPCFDGTHHAAAAAAHSDEEGRLRFMCHGIQEKVNIFADGIVVCLARRRPRAYIGRNYACAGPRDGLHV